MRNWATSILSPLLPSLKRTNVEASTTWSLLLCYGFPIANSIFLRSSHLKRLLNPPEPQWFPCLVAVAGIFYWEELKTICKLGELVSFLVAKTKYTPRIMFRKGGFICSVSKDVAHPGREVLACRCSQPIHSQEPMKRNASQRSAHFVLFIPSRTPVGRVAPPTVKWVLPPQLT